MGYGGYHPYPRRFGGGKTHLQVIHESLNASMGTGFDPQEDSVIYLENLAKARALYYEGWSVNARLGLQWDPLRTTDMLRRWERIFRIIPDPSQTEGDRRAELLRRWQRFGDVANHAKMESELSARLGDFFVQIEYISIGVAVVHSPDASYPWGTQVPNVPWSSTVAHVLVLLQKPAGATEGDFYDAAGKVIQILDPILPAWVTINWYRAPVSAPVNVPGGPSVGGFYLDDPHNLDNNVFSE